MTDAKSPLFQRDQTGMSEPQLQHPTANNCFAGALKRLMNDKRYESSVPVLAQISQILVKIDSEVPGATDALLHAILSKASA